MMRRLVDLQRHYIEEEVLPRYISVEGVGP